MNFTLKDLLDIPKLQALLDALNEIHSLPSAIIDTEGNILTATAWQDICTKFHRANPETEKRCKESDSYIAKELINNPPHVIYKCPFGLVDTATPIIVEGHHLGNVFTGQLCIEPPDVEQFICQAREYGFNEKDYLEALSKVPMISEERLLKNLKFLGHFTEMLATQGLIHKRQVETEETLRQDQALLRERNRFIESLINLSPDIIYIYDIVDNKNVYINYGIQKILGYTTPEINEMGIKVIPMLMHPDDLKTYLKETLPKYANAKDNEPIIHEYRMKHKDGTLRWLVSNEVIYLRKQDGSPKQIFGMIHDITELKQACEALKNMQVLFNETGKIAKIGGWEFDAETLNLVWTEEVYRIHEVDMTYNPTVSGAIAFYKPTSRPLIEQAVQRAIEHGEPFDMKLEIITAKGNYRWVHAIGQAQQENGKTKKVFGIFQDVTKHMKTEEELRSVTQRLELATQSAKLGIWDWDITNNKMVWDDLMLELYGFTPETFSGSIEAWQNGLHPEDRDKTIEGFQAALRGGKEWDTDFKVVHPDGTVKHIKANGIVIMNSEGTPIRMLGVNFDITEQRNLEAQLRQSQKLEAIGQLAGGIAHDFNNILSAIVGYAHLTLLNMREDDPSLTHIEQILESSEKASALTQSLLAFSRKQMVDLKVIDLNDTVRNFEKFLLRLIREDIELNTKYTGEDLPVLADRGQIEQVIMNFATNARDAMPEGGRLSIETRRITFDEEFIDAHGFGFPGEYACISVSDTGTGIDEETKDKIFDPFFTTKELGKGTGLGLAMVYGIVKKHCGYINVYSEPGKGTVFNVYLPITKAVPWKEDQKQQVVVSAQGGTETILVAEDDALLRKLTVNVLSHYGYTVIEAVDGEEAVCKFIENSDRIQLVLLDGIMPKKNGKEAYEEIKRLRPDIRVIFASGYSEEIFSKDGIWDTDANFLFKPVSPSDMIKKVRQVLDK